MFFFLLLVNKASKGLVSGKNSCINAGILVKSNKMIRIHKARKCSETVPVNGNFNEMFRLQLKKLIYPFLTNN